MIQSNIVLDNSSSVAAYMVWDSSISPLVMGNKAVASMMDKASKDTIGVLYLFTDRSYAIREYASEVNRIHSGKNRYNADVSDYGGFEWHTDHLGNKFEDFEQSIGE